MSHLEFWFDYSSPFAYLGSERIEALAERTSTPLHWKPFFLGGVFKAIGTPLVPINDASEQKRAYLDQDMARWANWFDIPMQWPTRFPMNTIKALRLTLVLDDPAPLIHRVFRAYWAEDQDINDPDVLGRCLEDVGLDSYLLERTADPQVKEALKETTTQAIREGVFGAPTVVVDAHGSRQLFWGQDRFHFVEKALTGWNAG